MMELLWNQVHLQRPPYRAWNASIKSFDSSKFIASLNKIVNEFSIFDTLNLEAALLSRLIYRMKSKFRSDKGLKNMEKVNRALLNYLNMDIQNDYKILKQYIEVNNALVTLPSKQTLEYILVRTQGFSKLMCRIESVAKISTSVLNSRLIMGHSWSVAIIAYAVISRIWMLSRVLIKRACNWYKTIYSYSKVFQSVGACWLPENYVFPNCLSQWLDLNWIDEELDSSLVKKNFGNSIFNLIKNNEEENNDVIECMDVVEPEAEKEMLNSTEQYVPNTLIKQGQRNDLISQIDDDLGEVISRKSFKKLNVQESTQPLKKFKGNNDSIEENDLSLESDTFKLIKTEKQLDKLLLKDVYPGLDKLQWNILKKKIQKIVMKSKKKNPDKALSEKLFIKINEFLSKWNNF